MNGWHNKKQTDGTLRDGTYDWMHGNTNIYPDSIFSQISIIDSDINQSILACSLRHSWTIYPKHFGYCRSEMVCQSPRSCVHDMNNNNPQAWTLNNIHCRLTYHHSEAGSPCDFDVCVLSTTTGLDTMLKALFDSVKHLWYNLALVLWQHITRRQ